jgi:dephospho-CoA kinase
MRLLGLTGGIGMGKSTVAAIFAQRGVAVADTDQLARDIVQPGQPALEEIGLQFGRRFVRSDGTLDREGLGALVFNDPAARSQLEAITHPRIRELWQAQVREWSQAGRDLAVVVIPLLFETGSAAGFEAVACVACTASTQRSRLRLRGWTDVQIEQRVAAQWPIQKKIDRAHFMIWNEGPADLLTPQVEHVRSAMT